LVLLLFVAIVGCAAIRQQKAMPAASDDLQFHNLRVLSPAITHDEMIATMRGYAHALGTRCEHCHVQTATEPRAEFDFPNDAKPEKRVARTMIAMTHAVNGEYVSKVNAHGQSVTCLTCHRGRTVPDTTVMPQPERRPGGAPGAPAEAPNAQPTPTPPPPPPGTGL
jgi:hypothetical protein